MVVDATLLHVEYQTKLNNHIRMEMKLNLALAGALAELGNGVIIDN